MRNGAFYISLLSLMLAGTSSPASAQFLTGYTVVSDAQPQAIFDEPVVLREEAFVAPVVENTSFEPAVEIAENFETIFVGFEPVLTAQNDTVVSVPLSSEPPADEKPVDFQAERLDYDEKNQIITASGDVFIEQEGRILRADEVVYDLTADTVKARGNVVLNEVSGDIHSADEVELKAKLKYGYVKELTSYLTDGSRFNAVRGDRTGGVKTVMRTAVYTACEACKTDPDKAPLWQIKASKITHDKEEQRIAYNNARFEVYGVPVAYLPYFSHSDPTVERESGFLAPSAGFKSDLGFFAQTQYYWNIAPHQDATFGLTGFSKENPLFEAQWRRRFDNASLQVEGGITQSERTESSGGVESLIDEEVRGHVFAEGLWNINDKWRAGADIQWASDDQYLRQYDLLDEDVLVSDIYAERFDDRDYLSARVLKFQDIRVSEDQEDQPAVLPEIIASFQGNPNGVPLIGGSWFVDGSYLGLRREGSEQDVDRLSLGGGWKRHFVSDTGFLSDIELSARQDLYNVRDRSDSFATSEETEGRFFTNAHVVSSYPLVRDFERLQVTIEPVVALSLAADVDDTTDIPNEDSQDVQLDSNNVFNANRFPGLDRVEDESRITYGVRTGLYDQGNGEVRAFLGQSYRFDDDDSSFPEGSGLTTRSSDVVGELAGLYKDDYSLNYRFQLDSRELNSRRHEVDLGADFGRFSLTSRYLFAKSLEGTDIDESREQLSGTAAYYLSDDWRARTGFTQDLGEDPGLRQAFLGLDYFGQCLFWSLTAQRNLTDDSSGESDTEILFRIGLKNIGEFEESGWHTP